MPPPDDDFEVEAIESFDFSRRSDRAKFLVRVARRTFDSPGDTIMALLDALVVVMLSSKRPEADTDEFFDAVFTKGRELARGLDRAHRAREN